MPTADDVLTVAESQLGVGETPPGSNVTPYSLWYGVIGPWCAMYCLWCADQVGLELPTFSAYVPSMFTDMQADGLQIPISEARGGDFCMFNFDGGLLDHVGIVIDQTSPNVFATIEGNTGDEVQHHVRSPVYGYSMVFCRPRYDQPEPPKPKRPQEEEVDSQAVAMPKEGNLFVWSIPNVHNTLGFLKTARPFLKVHNTNAADVTVQVWVTLDNTQTIGDPTFTMTIPKWTCQAKDLSPLIPVGMGAALTVKCTAMVAAQGTTYCEYPPA